MTKQSTDYFSLHGYREMALAVIEQALADLVQTQDVHLKQEAMQWIEFDPPKGAPTQGLTFAQCIEAAGASSACEVFRSRCRTEPETLRRDLWRMSMSVRSDKKTMESDDGNSRPGAFDTRTLLAATHGAGFAQPEAAAPRTASFGA